MVTNSTSAYLKAHAETESEGSRVEHIAEEFRRATQTTVLTAKSEDELRDVIIQIAMAGASRLGGRS